MSFTITPFAPFGAELSCDLSRPFSPDDAGRFREAFFEHGLLLIRGQSISHQRQVEIAAIIDTPLTQEGDAEILSNQDAKDIFGTAAIDYHSDNIFSPHPHTGVSLHALSVIEGDSSTRFVNTAQAAASLPAALRRKVEGRSVRLIATSDFTQRNRLSDQAIIPGAPWPQHIRPILDRHPITGAELISVNHNGTDAVVDMEESESEALLEDIFAHLYRAQAIYEHVWRNGDTIYWDNRALQHARPAIPGNSPRILQRVVYGGKSFGDMFPIIYDAYVHKEGAPSLRADATEAR